LVRHYPRGDLSAKSAEIGLAALTLDYKNARDQRERLSVLARLLDLARRTAETYTGEDQGDTARLLLGEVALGQGRYPEAVEAFESVREDSPRRLDALVQAGGAFWRHAAALR